MMNKSIFLAVALIAVIVPLFAQAKALAPNTNVWNPKILSGPLVVCAGTATPATTLSDGTVVPAIPACSNLCDLVAQIANVIYYAIAVVIWIITPILAAVGGIMIMLGGSNPGLIEKGKKTITGSVWGVGIVLSAWLIVKTFVSPISGIGISGVGGFSSSSLSTASAPACGL